jgi:hypothetical protein
MGVITTFPDNSKRYISMGANHITIHRTSGGDLVTAAEKTLYRVVGRFNMWTLNENDTVNETIGDMEIQLYDVSEINGVKLQEQLYEQLKKNLHNYEDDYVNRSVLVEEEAHVHTEEEAHVHTEDAVAVEEVGVAVEEVGVLAEDAVAVEDVGVLAEDAVAEPEV